jgi:hypothetical protein
MSRHNKVNKTNYIQRGRLTADDMARERMRQAQISGPAKPREDVIGKARSSGEREPSRPRSAPEE